ncbi:hypothetical protein TruAng_009909 [Truncatella angustata]|nr:hypothetical protein TruAng_009909 [Truncatella angustata]
MEIEKGEADAQAAAKPDEARPITFEAVSLDRSENPLEFSSARKWTCTIVETFQPVLIEKKAKQLGLPLPQHNFKSTLRNNLTRPSSMFLTEPILFLLSLYMAFVYGILYLDFTAYPYVFQQTRQWEAGISGLTFLGIGTGMAIATGSSPYINRVYNVYVKKLGGLFWFAWTSTPSIHWASCVLAGIPFGIGFVTLFLGITSYLIDCYGKYAASALAANAILRSAFGAVFPLFSRQIYDKLGPAWATSVLGFVAVGMAPLPWLFYKYGPWIRARSGFHQKMIHEEAAGTQHGK